mmetsp:Transcript_6441/g.18254  ORF Transcript_6441/g.18254 Transcript_6441/m.18254 type:complete len:460 (-) Transcript_6441:349-1728(-)
MNAALKVAVPRKDTGDNKVTLGDGLHQLVRERTTVTDAGHAAVSHDAKAKFLQRREETTVLEVARDDTRTRGQAGLDKILHRKPGLDGVLGKESRREHDRRVTGVGARSDGRDHDVTVAKLVLLAPVLKVDDSTLLLLRDGESLEPDLGAEAALKISLHISQGDVVLGALRAGQAGHDRGQVQAHYGRIVGGRSGLLEGPEQLLGAEIRLHVSKLLLGAAGLAEVADGSLVHREEAHGGAVLRGHVGQGGTVLDGETFEPLPKVLYKLTDAAVGAQVGGDREYEIGGGGARGELAHELVPHHLREDHADLLTTHDGLSLQPPNAPTADAQSVDHGGVGVGANHRVRVEEAVLVEHRASQELKVHLVHDARPGGHDAESLKGLRAPLEEAEALVVTFHLDLLVALYRSGVPAGHVHLHRMVNHQIHRNQRVDLLRFVSQGAHRLPHSRQVHHGRHARKVL